MGRRRKIGANELTFCIFYFIFTWLMFCYKGNGFHITRLKKNEEKNPHKNKHRNTHHSSLRNAQICSFVVGRGGRGRGAGQEKWWQWQGVPEELFTLGGSSLLQQVEK